jgi:anti-sigma factor RsiW
MPMETNVATNSEHLGERLHALLDRELSAHDESTARAHLASCSKCAAEHARLASAVTALGAMGTARAPEGFAARVLKRARAQRKSYGLRSLSDQKLQFEGAIIVIIAAAVAAAIITYEVKTNWGLFAKNEAKKTAVDTQK